MSARDGLHPFDPCDWPNQHICKACGLVREGDEDLHGGPVPEGVSGPEQGAAGGEMPDDFEPHPRYGPCDGFRRGECSKCAEIIFFGLAENERLRAALRSAPPTGGQT